MNTQAVEIIETEVPLAEATSLNHSRLISRLTVLLSAYERYDILPELEFELAAGRLKPDVAIVPRQQSNYQRDVLRVLVPPITAIKIISPTQSFDSLLEEIEDQYLPSGVKSAWLVLPRVGSSYLFLPGQPPQVFTSGILHDPAAQVDVALAEIFR